MLTSNDEILINNITKFASSKKGLIAFLNNMEKNTIYEINESIDDLTSMSKNYYVKKYQSDKYVYVFKYSLLYDILLMTNDMVFDINNFKNKVSNIFNFIRTENNNYSFYPKIIKETDNFWIFEKIEASNICPKIEDLNIIVSEFRLKNPFTKQNVISPFYHIFNADDYIYDKNMNLKFINITKLEEHENLGFMMYNHLSNEIYIYDLNPQSKIEEYYKYGCYDIESYKHSTSNIKFVDLSSNFKRFFTKYKMKEECL